MTSPHARILLTSTPDMRANYYGVRALDALTRAGDVVLHEGAEPHDGDALAAAAAGCRIIVADRNTSFAADVLARIPDVIAVLRVAVDVRNIDVEAASAHGILVCQASRTWVPAVSELVLGLMIDAARGISRANIAYKAGLAPGVGQGVQLAGATAGIIGYGPLARRVAELALAFGMHVVVHDPYVRVDRPDLTEVGLAELLREADFVLPLAVATPETENLIGRAELSQMKSTAYLINLSRGNLVDEAALSAALDARVIAGAALDVGRAPDQMPQPALAAHARVSATPHIGGLTRDAIEGQALETAAQAAAVLDGQVPRGALNAGHATRMRPAR